MRLELLSEIVTPVPISALNDNQLKELQTALSILGYPVGDIDGLIGPKTRNAWGEFKTDVYIGNPGLIGAESIQVLNEKMDELSISDVGQQDYSSKEQTIRSIAKECIAQGLSLETQIAYVLATTQWETNQTFRPVREAYWLDEEWRRKNLRYYPYYGRGFVQLTWENNYAKYSQIIGVNLVAKPDLAMEPATACFILVHGFKTGTFTGRKISDYIHESKTDFVRARRCINDSDRANEIADIAEKYLARMSEIL